MRIVIDLQGAQNDSRHRGIGRYSLALTRALLRRNTEHEVLILLSGLFPDTLAPLREALAELLPADNILTCHLPGPVNESDPATRLDRDAATLLREAFIAQLKPDRLLICSLFEGVFDNTVSSVKRLDRRQHTSVVLYDLIPLIHPERFLADPLIERWYQNKIEQVKRADLLLAISDSAASEARQLLATPEDALVTISTAVDPEFSPQISSVADQCTQLSALGITKPFIMHASAYEPRKNFEGLISAYARLPATLQNSYQLVLVCRLRDEQRSALEAQARRLNIPSGQLVLTGYLSDTDLIALYSTCHLFVFPSLHEGFGLPALEAMSCGAATIGSSTSSIPEVIGRDDALFDPQDGDAICKAIKKALTDQDYWQSLKNHAAEQSRRFSWGETARRTLIALESSDWRAQDEFSESQLLEHLADCCKAHAASDDALMRFAECHDNNRRLARQTRIRLERGGSRVWRVEGPFDSSYSLALLNRETARALHQLGHHVVLHSTEGPGDFEPDKAFLAANPDLALLHARVADNPAAGGDVQSRNLYPPRVHDMQGGIRLLHHYAWEESGFPSDWAEQFNQSLDGLTALSTHVEKILIDSGVAIPMTVSGCGVDHWERVKATEAPDLPLRGFRFLHVSSCFPRKGVEALLQAYGDAFTLQDDVSLVIKTFPNPHNTVMKQVHHWQQKKADYPHVLVLEQDLSDAELKALYQACDVLVAPSLAEGFGLPMAEAMLSGLPVITTGWGGQMDFCSADNAWLVDYRFARADTHFGLFASVWAEPDRQALAQCMKRASDTPTQQRQAMAAQGREHLLQAFTWRQVAQRCEDWVQRLSTQPRKPLPRVGWISTWNTPCGIADYTRHLMQAFPPENNLIFAAETDTLLGPDPRNCFRLWRAGKADNALGRIEQQLQQTPVDILIIQFNYGLYDFAALGAFMDQQVERGTGVVVMLHSTHDPYGETPNWRLEELRSALSRASRVMVHGVADLNRLKDMGLVDQVTLWPHGVVSGMVPETVPGLVSGALPHLMSFGFCLPHKGLAELVRAVALLRDQGRPVALTLMNAEYPAPESAALARELAGLIAELGLTDLVTADHAYQSDEDSIARMAQANLVIFPYQQTGESSSAAVRYGMSSGAPVAVTPLPIFEDLGEAVFRFDGTDVAALAAGISNVLNMRDRQDVSFADKLLAAERWRSEHDYVRLSRRLHGLAIALHEQL